MTALWSGRTGLDIPIVTAGAAASVASHAQQHGPHDLLGGNLQPGAFARAATEYELPCAACAAGVGAGCVELVWAARHHATCDIAHTRHSLAISALLEAPIVITTVVLMATQASVRLVIQLPHAVSTGQIP